MHFSKEKKQVVKTNSRQKADRSRKHFWKQGDSLTQKDLELLAEVVAVYEKQGYVPSKKEVSNVGELKGRFRTWKEVLMAAGLPDLHDGEQVQKRQQAALLKKEKIE